ncbi:hypothetical protein V2W45_560016 [Cenococcum geophilum]
MANLASTYRNQGRWKEAEELEVQVRHGNNQFVSYGCVGLHSNITNQIIIASADYVT